MALTPTEEALARQLIAQTSPLLSLAGSEPQIVSSLGAAEVTIADLEPVLSVAPTDLFVVRQGTQEKRATAAQVFDGADDALRADLANNTDPSKGSGIPSHNPVLAYPSGSSGFAINNLITDSRSQPKNKRRFIRLLDGNLRNVNVLVQGDSTGNANDEWVYLTAQRLAALYPAYSVSYLLWNDATTSYNTPVILQTGSGSNTIYVYNGAHSGATASYFGGGKKSACYAGQQFDLIITNYGHNIGSAATREQIYSKNYAQWLNLITDQPQAEILAVNQNPDLDNLAFSERRMLALDQAAQALGIETVDVYTLFKEKANSPSGVASWMADGVHPSAAGSIAWADLVTQTLTQTTGNHTRFRLASMGKKQPGKILNCDFSSWLNGTSAAPTWWTLSNCTALRDASFFETKGCSMRLGGTAGSTGVAYVRCDEAFANLTQDVTIAVRIRVPSSNVSSNAGRIDLTVDVLGTPAYMSSWPDPLNETGAGGANPDGFHWHILTVPRSFYRGKNGYQIAVYSGQTGDIVSVDRIVISEAPDFIDVDGTRGRNKFAIADGTHNVAANSTSPRTFTSAAVVSVKGCNALASTPDLPAGLSIAAVSHASGNVTVLLTNYTGSSVSMPATTYEFETY